MDSIVEQFGFLVTLNVGGCYFTTTLPVLCKYEGSRLAAIFNGFHVAPKDEEGRFFIDRDGTNFGHVLNFLRDSQLPPMDKVKDVYREALYYMIEPLAEVLRRHSSVFEEEEEVSFAEQCPEALEKVIEVTSILRKRFAGTLNNSREVALQFPQAQAWKSLRKRDNPAGDVSISHPPQELNGGPARQDHRCSSPDVLLGEMSESDKIKHLNFFTRYLDRLGYNVTVTERDCGDPVWCQSVEWSNGPATTTIHCAKKLHILTFQ